VRPGTVARVAVWLAGWAAGWWLAWDLPALRRARAGRDDRAAGRTRAGAVVPGGQTVAVVVPARDEQGSLPALLSSLAAQHPRPSEVVVVDDASSDATGSVAAAGGATVVPAGERPPGWTGKTWACDVGVRATAAEVLVLLDADVELAPGALAALVAEHEDVGGLLSVLPEHRPVRAYEQASAPCNVVSVMGTGAATPGARGRSDGAFGPCLVVRRSTLQAVGGFESVRADVVEDLALARRVADLGLAVTARRGGDLVGFRMYPDGPGQLVEGWTKNLAAGAAAVPRHRAALVGLWVTSGLLPVVVVLTGRARRRFALGAAVLAWAASGVQFHVLVRRVGRFRWWVGPAHPALLGAFTGLVVRSEVARRRGVVRWKGRQVAVGRGGTDGELGGVGGPSMSRRGRVVMRSMRARL
jgi:4,4'-diaponeurosporenoate glycosyltransferase